MTTYAYAYVKPTADHYGEVADACRKYASATAGAAGRLRSTVEPQDDGISMSEIWTTEEAFTANSSSRAFTDFVHATRDLTERQVKFENLAVLIRAFNRS